MRHLILLDVVHDAADLGLPAAVADRRQDAIQDFWDRLEQELDRWELPLGQVLLFQEGLAAGERMYARVDELAQRGSRNHRLLQRLLAGGATLVGVEDPRLLLQEHALAGAARSAGQLDECAAADLLAQRDRFIAARIDAGLTVEHLGLCFLGPEHDLPAHLPADISVNRPVRRTPGHR